MLWWALLAISVDGNVARIIPNVIIVVVVPRFQCRDPRFFSCFFLIKKRSLFISFFVVVEQKLLYESLDFAAFVACHNCYTLTKIALYYDLYVFVSTTNET